VIRPGKEFASIQAGWICGHITGLYADKGYLRTEVLAEPERKPDQGTVDYKINMWKAPLSTSTACTWTETLTPKLMWSSEKVLLKSGDIFSLAECADRSKKSIILASSTMSRWMSNSPEVLIWLTLFFQWKRESLEFFRQGLVFQVLIDLWEPCKCPTPIFWIGAALECSYEFGARRQNFDIGWTILGSWIQHVRGVDVFNTVRVRIIQATETLSRKTPGVSLRLGPRLSDDFADFFLGIRMNRIYL